MESYPCLNTSHIYSYVIDDFTLTSYPNSLVFGQPIFNHNSKHIQYKQNSYLKILPYYYKEWIKVFKKIMKCNLESETNKTCFSYKIYESSFTTLTCSKDQNETYKFEVQFTYENLPVSTAFLLNIHQIVELYKGFQILFFDPLLLPQQILFILSYIINTQDINNVTLLSHKNIFKFLTPILQNLHLKEDQHLYAISNDILRCKITLLQNMELLTLIPII